MIEYETITFDVSNDVAVITLNRPKQKNAMSTQMRAELTHAIQEAQKMARALVFTGAGRFFCAGQDFGNTKNATKVDLERVLRDEYRPLLQGIHESDIPVLAAVNGPAIGIGANLALAADVTIATSSAEFIQSFASVGLMPDAAASFHLPRNIGLARAMGAMALGEPISALRAQEWGMIWEAVPDAEFEQTWQERANKLAGGPTVAFSKMRQAVRSSFETGFEDQLSKEARAQGALGKTRDFQEGMLAAQSRRMPDFEGR